MAKTKISKTGKEVKRKMSGWLIALIVIVALVAVGGICCNTIGKTQEKKNPVQNTADIREDTAGN